MVIGNVSRTKEVLGTAVAKKMDLRSIKEEDRCADQRKKLFGFKMVKKKLSSSFKIWIYGYRICKPSEQTFGP